LFAWAFGGFQRKGGPSFQWFSRFAGACLAADAARSAITGHGGQATMMPAQKIPPKAQVIGDLAALAGRNCLLMTPPWTAPFRKRSASRGAEPATRRLAARAGAIG
jgi:hypothetical protein